MVTKDHRCEYCAKPVEVETYEWKDAKIDCREEQLSDPEKYAADPCEDEGCDCGGITRAEKLQSNMEYHYLWGRFYAGIQNIACDMIHVGMSKDEVREKLQSSFDSLFEQSWVILDAVECPTRESWHQAVTRREDERVLGENEQ